jgi:hypothetical protein
MDARTKPDLLVIWIHLPPCAVSVLHGPVFEARSVKSPELGEYKSKVEQLPTL